MTPTSPLAALSPLDGRYQRRVTDLAALLCERSLIAHRVRVEVAWFRHLAACDAIPELPRLTASAAAHLDRLVAAFDGADAAAIADIERRTNHDVKAVEYWVKAALRRHADLAPHVEFVHFALTSEDVNNLAYALMLAAARDGVLLPAMARIEATLSALADTHAAQPMLARTHGQAASPTTVGKELRVFVERLGRQRRQLARVEVLGKCNGAVGNYNAHVAACPGADWIAISRDFVASLGLSFNPHTTQIEPHDWIAEYAHAMVRWDAVALDLARDLWGYVSLDYFRQRRVDGETGSSTMPHKVNPIDFENAEGNLGIASALLEHLAAKLPVSRWQRDLSDSTALRSLGTALGHAVVAMHALQAGLGKLDVNVERLDADLDRAWEVLAEAVQTAMRRAGIADPYERLKAQTRGERLDAAGYQALLAGLGLPEPLQRQLAALTPRQYVGLAATLARAVPSPDGRH
jgi:adenylosuccinate lyase